MTELVNHPAHYGHIKCECGRTIECIDVTQHMSFPIGNAVKYLWRVDSKGMPIQDLEKAAWYINREIKRRKAKIEKLEAH